MTDQSAHELHELARLADGTVKQKLLIVDDDPHVRRTLARMLAIMGHIISEAATAEEAERIAEQDAFDAIVTDLRLPDIPGNELILRLRQTRPHLGAIIVSGFGDYEEILRGVKNGSWHLLNKPFEFEALEKAVKIVTDHRTKSST